jgi:hypothetical protein
MQIPGVFGLPAYLLTHPLNDQQKEPREGGSS